MTRTHLISNQSLTSPLILTRIPPVKLRVIERGETKQKKPQQQLCPFKTNPLSKPLHHQPFFLVGKFHFCSLGALPLIASRLNIKQMNIATPVFNPGIIAKNANDFIFSPRWAANGFFLFQLLAFLFFFLTLFLSAILLFLRSFLSQRTSIRGSVSPSRVSRSVTLE